MSVTSGSNLYLSANVLKLDPCTAGIDLPPVGPVRHRGCALRAVSCRLEHGRDFLEFS